MVMILSKILFYLSSIFRQMLHLISVFDGQSWIFRYARNIICHIALPPKMTLGAIPD